MEVVQNKKKKKKEKDQAVPAGEIPGCGFDRVKSIRAGRPAGGAGGAAADGTRRAHHEALCHSGHG